MVAADLVAGPIALLAVAVVVRVAQEALVLPRQDLRPTLAVRVAQASLQVSQERRPTMPQVVVAESTALHLQPLVQWVPPQETPALAEVASAVPVERKQTPQADPTMETEATALTAL